MTTIKEDVFTRSNFLGYKATEKLKSLAVSPLDLTKPGSITPERIANYCAESCGYKLLYATERVTDEVLDALVDLAMEAQVLEKMQRMQSGEVLNFIKGYPSENRAVLHTATRDFFENPHKNGPAREAAEMAKVELEKMKAFISKIESEGKFTDCIMIGIGGSDLGPYAQFVALEHLKKPGKRNFFINNVDPDNAASVLTQADLAHTLVIVVSKSGTTTETATNEAFARARFVEAGLNPAEHIVAVTGEGSPMDDPAKYLESFYIWDWVGGRFSTSSMIGGVLLAFSFGFDVFMEFLRGANAMDKVALSNDMQTNLPLMAALLTVWNLNFLHYPTLAMIPYSKALSRYSAHVQQVEMESNGKHIDRLGQRIDFDTGPIIWGEPGTNAQHSFYQLIHQGTEIVALELIGFKESQFDEDMLFENTTSQEKLLANLFAQAIALATGQKSDNPNKEFLGNRPSHLLLAKKATPFAIGALLAFYEHKTVFQGFIWNINSFDQEGVQLGKVLAKKITDRLAAKRTGGNAEAFPLGDALLKQLDSL